MIKLVIEVETNNTKNTLLSVQMNKGNAYLLVDMAKVVLTGTGEVLTQDVNNNLNIGQNYTFVTKFETSYIVTWHSV